VFSYPLSELDFNTCDLRGDTCHIFTYGRKKSTVKRRRRKKLLEASNVVDILILTIDGWLMNLKW
jgi:hypothetical protein